MAAILGPIATGVAISMGVVATDLAITKARESGAGKFLKRELKREQARLGVELNLLVSQFVESFED